MSALLAAELLKLRTTRTFVVLVASALALSLLISGAVAALADDLVLEDLRALVQLSFASVFVLVLGVIGMAGEWRHRTIAGSLLAAPDRVRFLLAKVAAYAVAGVVLSAVVTVCTMLLVTAILAARGDATLPFADFLGVLWPNLVVAACFGALGVGVGALIRNQAGAIVILLVLLLVAEPTIAAFWPEGGKFLPLSGAPAGLAANNTFDGLEEQLAPGIALLVELGWVALIVAAAAATLRARDV